VGPAALPQELGRSFYHYPISPYLSPPFYLSMEFSKSYGFFSYGNKTFSKKIPEVPSRIPFDPPFMNPYTISLSLPRTTPLFSRTYLRDSPLGSHHSPGSIDDHPVTSSIIPPRKTVWNLIQITSGKSPVLRCGGNLGCGHSDRSQRQPLVS